VGDRKRIRRRLNGARWQPDPKWVAVAAAEFRLDPKNPRDRERLLHILAHAIFAPGMKGRPKDTTTAWPSSRLITLGEIYERKKKQHPRLSDAKIAKLIKDEHREFKHDQPEQIRQRLRKAHRYYESWVECRDYDDEPPEDWEGSWEESETDDD
jgi:hypothetical protein